MNAWIGANYGECGRLLILGESWYDADEPLDGYVRRWARGEQQDTLFACLYNALSGRRREESTAAQRLGWWGTFAFCNFVPGSLGPTNAQRPTPAQFRAAQGPFAATLERLKPAGVWIVGLEHSEYSRPVVEKAGAFVEVVRHPRSGVKSQALLDSWLALRGKVAR